MSDIVKEGPIHYVKNAMIFSFWSSVYAILTKSDRTLWIFNSEKDAQRRKYNAKYTIPSDLQILSDAKDVSEKHKFVFRMVHPDGTRMFSLQNAQDMSEWKDALENFHVHRKRELDEINAAEQERRRIIAVRALFQPPSLELFSADFRDIVVSAHLLNVHDVLSVLQAAYLRVGARGRWPQLLPDLPARSIMYQTYLTCGPLAAPWYPPAEAVSDRVSLMKIAIRAHSCIVAAILGGTQHGMHGAHGQDGMDGAPGIHGRSGMGSGSNGGPGGPGGCGTNGFPGMPGAHAFPGSSANLMLSGYDASSLCLVTDGSFIGNIPLGPAGVLLIDAKGGDGGHGGQGGRGGDGGPGGPGGNGSRGRNGSSASSKGARGGNGGPGGDGGHGGCGGSGGNGQPGGTGGNAGAGGHVLVKAVDPRLFMLVECDARQGDHGRGGAGGRAGRGGAGGHGGAGGSGGSGGSGGPGDHERGISSGSSGFSGSHGSRGHRGHDGSPGMAGANGMDGAPASDGSVAFMHVKDNGMGGFDPVACSGYRYEAALIGAVVSVGAVVPDAKERDTGGVIVPGGLIRVGDLTVLNDGGLELPSGALVTAEGTETLTWETADGKLCQELPSIPKDGHHVVKTETLGRVFDIPPPQLPERFQAEATFTLGTSLLGRPFHWSNLSMRVPVKWPVYIAEIHIPSVISLQETVMITVALRNESTIPFDSSRVQLVLELAGKIVPLPSTGPAGAAMIHGRCSTLPCRVEPDDASSPGTVTFDAALPIRLAANALLYERYRAKLTLWFDGRPIEFRESDMRVAPRYVPNVQRMPSAEICMFSSKNMTRNQYVAFTAFFNALGMTVDIWDAEREQGISVNAQTGQRHAVSWIGRYRGGTLLFCDPRRQVPLVQPIDIVDHFVGSDWRTWATTKLTSVVRAHEHGSYGSGCVMLGMPERQLSSVLFARIFKEASLHMTCEGNEFGGMHMISEPKEADAIVVGNGVIDDLNKKDSDHWFRAEAVHWYPEKASLRHYYYGTMDVRMMPLLRSTRLCVIEHLASDDLSRGMPHAVEQAEYESAAGSSAALGGAYMRNDRPTHLPQVIPVASELFEALVAIVRSRPMPARVALLGAEQFRSICFSLPGTNAMLPFPQVIAMTIFDELSSHHRTTSNQIPLLDQYVRAVERYALLGRNAYRLHGAGASTQEQYEAAAREAADNAPSQNAAPLDGGNERKHFKQLSALEVVPLLSIMYKYQTEVLGFFDGSELRSEFFALKERIKRICLPPSGPLRKMLKSASKDLSKSRMFYMDNLTRVKLPLAKGEHVAVRPLTINHVRQQGARSQTQWQLQRGDDDDDGKACAVCENEFGFLRHKHHCRACGMLVCDPCSEKRFELISKCVVGETVRVCDTCHTRLSGLRTEKRPEGPPPPKGLKGQEAEDRNKSHCRNCDKKFGLMTSAYACSSCNWKSCSSCSDNQAIVPHLGLLDEKQVVCNACFMQLTGIAWQPMDDAKECLGCRRNFGFLRKKHHCHSCGGVHCSACIRNEYNVPCNPNEGHAPVCDACYLGLISNDIMMPEQARAYFKAQIASQLTQVGAFKADQHNGLVGEVSKADAAAVQQYADLSSVQMSISDPGISPVAPDWSHQALYMSVEESKPAPPPKNPDAVHLPSFMPPSAPPMDGPEPGSVDMSAGFSIGGASAPPADEAPAVASGFSAAPSSESIDMSGGFSITPSDAPLAGSVDMNAGFSISAPAADPTVDPIVGGSDPVQSIGDGLPSYDDSTEPTNDDLPTYEP